jgi:hypothetical protein
MISGSIPTEFGNLELITQLRLNDNRLTGEVPDELGQLETLGKCMHSYFPGVTACGSAILMFEKCRGDFLGR